MPDTCVSYVTGLFFFFFYDKLMYVLLQQIGTKGRSEKIRTYNFSQDRITDHRIGKTVHDVHGFLQGEELLEEVIVFLQQFSEQESLMDILKDSDYNQ